MILKSHCLDNCCSLKIRLCRSACHDKNEVSQVLPSLLEKQYFCIIEKRLPTALSLFHFFQQHWQGMEKDPFQRKSHTSQSLCSSTSFSIGTIAPDMYVNLLCSGYVIIINLEILVSSLMDDYILTCKLPIQF